MYGVLIVDDEEPVLESYSFMLESGIDGFRLAGAARSGYEAIKMIYEIKPDVVFMDINMPGLDGLETISEVHDKFPDTVFILQTAYERFDLARRAIPLGVFAYLVKPVTKATFRDTLMSVADALHKRRSPARDSRPDSALRRFLVEDVWKEIPPARWEELRDGLSLDTDRGLIAFIGADMDLDALLPSVNARLTYRYRFHTIVHLSLGMYFFPGDVDRDELARFIPVVLREQVPQGTVSIYGVGSVRPFAALHLSCAEALGEINRSRDYTDLRLRERMLTIQIRRKIGLSPFDEVAVLFASYRDEVFASFPFPLAKAKMVALFTLLVDDCTGCFQSYSGDAPPFAVPEEISALADLSAWNDWAVSAFNRLYQCARSTRTGKFPVPLVKAVSFIEENFDRQIQLADAAAAASVSSAYLSRLFGEHMASSFIDCLTARRIEKAERLIREKRMNIKEVAFAVGYQDPNYFSKIFRKTVGVSPSMYAERNGNAQ
jgi:two-component system, response regulator YesN